MGVRAILAVAGWAALFAAAPGLASPARAAPVEGAYLVVDIDAWGERAAEIERDRADLMRTLDSAGVAYSDPQMTGPVITLRLNDPVQYPAAERALKSFTVNEIPAEVSLEPDGRTKVVVPTAWTMAGGGDDLDAAIDAVIERAQARGFGAWRRPTLAPGGCGWISRASPTRT